MSLWVRKIFPATTMAFSIVASPKMYLTSMQCSLCPRSRVAMNHGFLLQLEQNNSRCMFSLESATVGCDVGLALKTNGSIWPMALSFFRWLESHRNPEMAFLFRKKRIYSIMALCFLQYHAAFPPFIPRKNRDWIAMSFWLEGKTTRCYTFMR
jgi:hypothetical protein